MALWLNRYINLLLCTHPVTCIDRPGVLIPLNEYSGQIEGHRVSTSFQFETAVHL